MAERDAKKARSEPSSRRDDVTGFLQSWAWKREHRPDRDRFQRPYIHTLTIPGSTRDDSSDSQKAVKLTLQQDRFRGAQGFASTVWDSSIVVAKLLERNPHLVSGRSVLDLSAGCGLGAVVASRLGARRTVATDLPPNLPLLRRNCERNGAAVEVMEHWWGTDTGQLVGGPSAVAVGDARGRSDDREVQRGGMDLVIACDVMYLEEAAGPLVATLAGLCGGSYDSSQPIGDGRALEGAVLLGRPGTGDPPLSGHRPPAGDLEAGGPAGEEPFARGLGRGPFAKDSNGAGAGGAGTLVILAHGRNRFAEGAFWRHAAAAGFEAWTVPWDALDPVYRCSDVDVYGMRLLRQSKVAAPGKLEGAESAAAVTQAGAKAGGAKAGGAKGKPRTRVGTGRKAAAGAGTGTKVGAVDDADVPASGAVGARVSEQEKTGRKQGRKARGSG